MKYIFITGIPTAGKSYLAEKVAQKTNSVHIDVDKFRKTMAKNPSLKSWVDFFWNKDEKEYWENISPQEHWNNLKKQSEIFWPAILKEIHKIQKTGKSTIFEGVNILPHLAHQDLDFPGVVLLGESEQVVFERCRKCPRWGKSDELQRKEAEWFFTHEGNFYQEEANKYGYKTFYDNKKAEEYLIKLLSM